MTRAYGLGELPGTSIAEACDVIVSETPLVHVPQLPGRGVGSDAVGRSASLLEGLNVEPGVRAWRLVAGQRPALDQLDRDLDECQATWQRSFDKVKVQVVGPWTLAACLELADGHRALTDPGALRDIFFALSAGVHAHADDVARRFDAEILLQVDEPLLADVVSGRLAGAHRFDEIRAYPDATQHLRDFIAGLELEDTLINTSVWEAAQGTLLVPRARVYDTAAKDALGQVIAGGQRVALAVEGEPREIAEDIASLWRELGLDPLWLADRLDVVPARVGGSLVEAARFYRAAADAADLIAHGLGDL